MAEATCTRTDNDDPKFQTTLTCALECIRHGGLRPKPEQEATIRSIYQGRDMFAWLLTGFGKSLCYEAIPFVYDWKLCRENSLVLVVSPILALMVDQVNSLQRRNVRAAIFSESAGDIDKELIATEEDLHKASILYGAPEAVVRSKWRDT